MADTAAVPALWDSSGWRVFYGNGFDFRELQDD
jgi:hypothetical protein